MTEFDILITNGTVVDGTGEARYVADVGIRGGMIAAVGARLPGTADRTVDATGHLVTPGWIDVHTHFDGQATWDDTLDPCFSHGVTTLVMGNCGVGFAPVRPGSEQELIGLMEGVEDIPGTALYEGMPWGAWETYPQYLDYLGTRRYAMDVASQLTHGALRHYVMGDRAIFDRHASADDIAAMATIVVGAMEAGSVGFSTNRIIGHKSTSGQPVPGTYCGDDELIRLCEAMASNGAGVVQLIPSEGVGEVQGIGRDPHDNRQEIALMGHISRTIDRPITFTLQQTDDRPDYWREALARTDAENARGAKLHPQVAVRQPGFLSGLLGYHYFQRRETYLKLCELPLSERVEVMRRPEVKQAILVDPVVPDENPGSWAGFMHDYLGPRLGDFWSMDANFNYEPTLEESVGGIAARTGESPASLMYDLLLERDGANFLMMFSVNYADKNHELLREMLIHPASVPGLADAGAHVKFVCDGSAPTYSLIHWVRDRTRGERLPLEWIVHKQTQNNAQVYGMRDRGTIAAGKRADINVIDFDNLSIGTPHRVHDLPAGAWRLHQSASGYLATFVNGVMTRWRDSDTGERPGRLLRGAA